jgi:hypothetical protein
MHFSAFHFPFIRSYMQYEEVQALARQHWAMGYFELYQEYKHHSLFPGVFSGFSIVALPYNWFATKYGRKLAAEDIEDSLRKLNVFEESCAERFIARVRGHPAVCPLWLHVDMFETYANPRRRTLMLRTDWYWFCIIDQ